MKLLQRCSGHVTQALIEVEDPLPCVEREIAPGEAAVLAIGKFIAQNASDAWLKSSESEVREEVQAVRALPLRIHDPVPNDGEIGDTSESRTFHKQENAVVAIDHDLIEA